MKTIYSIIFLFILLILGCKEKKTAPVPKVEPEVEIVSPVTEVKEPKKPEIEIQNSKVYQKITDLQKYKDFNQLVGMVLEGTDKALVYLQKDSIQVLVLEQMIRNSTAKPSFSILDEVTVIADSSTLFSELAACKLINNPNDRFIFGIAKDQDKKYFDTDHLLKVWEVDLSVNAFKEIESEKVTCLNQWFGYDG